jgi:Dolichyl-phosphate-mannose-protein mannosyltransferase
MTATVSEREPDLSQRLTTIAGVVWILCFLTLFFWQTLPNNPSVTRMMVVESLVDTALGTNAVAAPEVVPAGWRFFSQRTPIASWAIVILLAAWLQGAACFRLPWLRLSLPAAERLTLQLGLGLATFSLVVLFAGWAGYLRQAVLLAPATISAVILIVDRRRVASAHEDHVVRNASRLSRSTRIFDILMWCTIVGTALWLLLGAMSPPTDFDVREYHLQGPKEWFHTGQITFLSHNVYTSFPFLSEMFSLAGMVLTGNWWQGALVGKFVLACFAPLTTLAVYCMARRLVDHHIGLLAALIHITTPWTVRISIIAYAEGALSFYFAASTLCLLMFRESRDSGDRRRIALMTGLFAGSAMACKYTGLISPLLPAGLILAAYAARGTNSASGALTASAGEQTWRTVLLFVAGIVFVIGPWLIRNYNDTGNPVYPLAWTVMGGSEWDAEVNERWKSAHGPNEHSLVQIPQHFLDFAVRNDWVSPLLFALSIPALFLWRRIPGLPLVAYLVGWHFLTWWGLTHRIDRFWVPVIPLVAVLAACSRRLSSTRGWRFVTIIAIALCTVFNLRFSTLALVGYHAGFQDLDVARQVVIRDDIRRLNATLPVNAKVLMVGEAEVFDCAFPVEYNTVFDDCIFEQLVGDASVANVPTSERGMKSPDECQAALAADGITHVMVNWSEILRYRGPGSYGYAEFVQPSRFRQLVEAGVLKPPVTLLQRSWNDLSDQDQRIIGSWDGADYIHTGDGVLRTVQLYETVPNPREQ